MEKSPFWEASSHVTQLVKLLPLMQTKGSLPCSQEPATGPYPEPDAA
jgi:hypothetical protein